jgi:excisionase family DNA binding protein
MRTRKTDSALHAELVFYAPRGLSRDEAARYIGVGTTKFDEMVADGRMPRPKRIDGRTD